MRTIIAGSRGFTDYDQVLYAVETARLFCDIVPTTILSGAEPSGVDRLGERYAKENGIALELHPADWDSLGRGAGFIRNSIMASKAVALIAVWNGRSPGTKQMIDAAKRRKLALFVHRV